MAAVVQRMVNTRHRSSGFLQSGWIAAIRLGERAVPAKYRRFDSSGAPPPSDMKSVDPDHGTFIPAQEGALTAVCEIQNRIGLAGGFGVLDAKRNQALWEIGAQPLQDAINNQAERTAEYVLKKESEATFRALEARGILHYSP
jgi:hypothetical protein